jgi:hypothetical protein
MIHGVTERTRIGKWDTTSFNKSIFGAFNLRHNNSGGNYNGSALGRIHFPRFFRPEPTNWMTNTRDTDYNSYDPTISFMNTFICGDISQQDPRPSCDADAQTVYDLYEITCTAQYNQNNSNEGGNISKKCEMYKISTLAGKSGEVVKYGSDEYMIWRPSINQGKDQFMALAIKIS